MHDARTELAPHPAQVFDLVEECIDHCSIPVADGGMNDHPGGLVDDDEVPVLKENLQREVLCQGLHRAGLRHREDENLPALEAHGGLQSPPTERHRALFEEALETRTGELREDPREVQVHPLPARAPGDHVLALYQIFDFTCALGLRMTSTTARS